MWSFFSTCLNLTKLIFYLKYNYEFKHFYMRYIFYFPMYTVNDVCSGLPVIILPQNFTSHHIMHLTGSFYHICRTANKRGIVTECETAERGILTKSSKRGAKTISLLTLTLISFTVRLVYAAVWSNPMTPLQSYNKPTIKFQHWVNKKNKPGLHANIVNVL